MSRVFVNIGLSLDGYMAPEGMTLEHWEDPGYRGWGARWGALMRWLMQLQYFRENHGFGPGGETGAVNDMLRHTTQRIGVNIMGKRMFEQAREAAGGACSRTCASRYRSFGWTECIGARQRRICAMCASSGEGRGRGQS